MHFDLLDLRLFQAAARQSSVTRAAEAQHLSLPAGSARIKALEGRAGVPLLYREARGVRLTPAGEALLHHSRAILRQTEQLRADLDEYGRGLRGHVRIHANTTAFTDILPEVLPGFLKANPKVNVRLQEKQNAEIALAVLDGRADVGIVSIVWRRPDCATSTSAPIDWCWWCRSGTAWRTASPLPSRTHWTRIT